MTARVTYTFEEKPNSVFMRHVTPRTKTVSSVVWPGDPDEREAVLAWWSTLSEGERRVKVWELTRPRRSGQVYGDVYSLRKHLTEAGLLEEAKS